MRCRSAACVQQLYVSILHGSQADVGDPAALFVASFDAMTEDWRSRWVQAVRVGGSRGSVDGGDYSGHANYSWLHHLSDSDRQRALVVLLVTELRQLSFKTGEELSSEQLGLPAVTDDDQEWASAFIADAVQDGLITAPQPDAAAAVSAACPDEAAGRAARVRRACDECDRACTSTIQTTGPGGEATALATRRHTSSRRTN